MDDSGQGVDSRVAEYSVLCSTCSNITFTMLLFGFEHPLPYSEAIESGRNCKFCRLMVCSYARLQVFANAYEVERDYEAFIPKLKASLAVSRHQVQPNNDNPNGLREELITSPAHMCWNRHKDWNGLYGHFSDGCTIQISAPEGFVKSSAEAEIFC
jgi:hypothetical protein